MSDRATLRQATFEDVDPDAERYPVVLAAQCFHWADPHTRWQRLGALLAPDGRGFLCWNGWSLDGTAHDLGRVQQVYAEHGHGLLPDIDADRSDAGWAEAEIEMSAEVALVERRRYDWPWVLPTQDYVDLLTTTSGYAAADPQVRTRLLQHLAGVLGPTTTLAAGTLLLVVAPA